MPLTLEQANRIVEIARGKAEEFGRPSAIAVVDAAGHLVALNRMDGSRFHLVDMAWGKAFTAAALHRESGSSRDSPFFESGPQLITGRIVPLVGGFPIVQDGEVIGGAGIAGGTDEQNTECIKTALAEVIG